MLQARINGWQTASRANHSTKGPFFRKRWTSAFSCYLWASLKYDTFGKNLHFFRFSLELFRVSWSRKKGSPVRSPRQPRCDRTLVPPSISSCNQQQASVGKTTKEKHRRQVSQNFPCKRSALRELMDHEIYMWLYTKVSLRLQIEKIGFGPLNNAQITACGLNSNWRSSLFLIGPLLSIRKTYC